MEDYKDRIAARWDELPPGKQGFWFVAYLFLLLRCIMSKPLAVLILLFLAGYTYLVIHTSNPGVIFGGGIVLGLLIASYILVNRLFHNNNK